MLNESKVLIALGRLFVYQNFPDKSFLSFGVSLAYFFRGEEVESEYRAAQKARARISVSQTLDNSKYEKYFQFVIFLFEISALQLLTSINV